MDLINDELKKQESQKKTKLKYHVSHGDKMTLGFSIKVSFTGVRVPILPCFLTLWIIVNSIEQSLFSSTENAVFFAIVTSR